MSFSDPALVRAQYATETNLAARRSIYGETTGPDARQLVFDAVAEAAPRDVLDVGCGDGELAALVAERLAATVVAVDQSERMVELARARGVDARVGDAQELPFPDESFDVVVAAWMLYHVENIERALTEIRRVLRPGGRLVAATNHEDHLQEMFALVDITSWPLPFSGENGEEILGRFFPQVELRPAYGTVTLRDTDAIRRYLGSMMRCGGYLGEVPELDGPLVARRRPVVFVATR